MVASQGASEAFTADFLDDRENWAIIEQAQIYCSEVKIFKKFYFKIKRILFF
jgi:hypothetical protein